jgi:hypothetical protein
MKTTRHSFFPSITFSYPLFRLPLSYLLLTFLTLLVTNVATAQVPSYVPTNGLVGYWPFNGNANDESGNGNNGTVNGATLAADRFGNVNSAYSFAGVPERIDIGTNLNPNFSIGTPTSSWSVSSWINRNNFNGVIAFSDYNSIAGNNNPGENDMTFITLNVDQSLAYASFRTNGEDVYVSGGNISSDQWHQIAYTVNNGILKLFVDGNEVAQTFFDSNFNFYESPFYRIGAAMWNGNYGGGTGIIDDIGIFNRALTADEVLALYNGCNVAPAAIVGSNTPGAFATSTYTCDNTAGSTYNWTVTNGVIASGQGTNSVSILWGAEGVGSVSVVETTVDGCVGDAVIYDVNVQCVVSGDTIEGPVGPEAFSNSTYTCNGAANSNYQWTITNGVIVSGQGTNSLTILWASTGLGNVSVVETTYEGCVGTTLSQDVVVIPTNVEELSNALILYPNPVTTELNLQTITEFIGSDLIIFDALGKQIHKQQILSTNTRINTSAFSAGNYVVKVGGGVKKFAVVR